MSEITIDEIIKQAVAELEAADSIVVVDELRIRYLGRKGVLTAQMKQLGALPAEERPIFGQQVNAAKEAINAAIESASMRLKSDASDTEKIDITLPGRRRFIGHKHPISQVMDDMVKIFRRLGFIVADGPVIEDEYHNFDALNTPDDHPSRDVQDTFYFADGRLMRTQTSTVQIRVMEKVKPPVRIVAPGRCFRRDTPDATHSMNFHQIEGLYVNKNVSLADLKGTLAEFAKEMFGEQTRIRLRPHFFPFTEPSLECDCSCFLCKGDGTPCRLCKGSGWIEIAGAGMVDPNVFISVGYDPEIWTGYAFGMGVERIAMIRMAINDIRYLYENDVRFLAQF